MLLYSVKTNLLGGEVTDTLFSCQGLRCVVAMLASELLRLPAFKLSRLSCEVAMFVKYRSCQGLSCEVVMFVCNICHRLRCVAVYF